MCNSIFGKGQQVVGAGQDGVRRGLTLRAHKGKREPGHRQSINPPSQMVSHAYPKVKVRPFGLLPKKLQGKAIFSVQTLTFVPAC
jgi:hypothetical protein